MLSNPQLYLFYLLFSCLLFWIVPPSLLKVRAWIIIILSAIFLMALVPYPLVFVISVTLLIVMQSYIPIANERFKLFFKHFLVLVLIFSFLVFRYNGKNMGLYITTGLTFSFLRAFSLLNKSFKKTRELSFTNSFLYMLFFPAFTTGPIAKLSTLSISNLNSESNKLEWRKIAIGFVRICMGLFKVVFISSFLFPYIEPLSELSYTQNLVNGNGEVLSFCLLSFLLVYVNFSGISDVVIGSAMLFGIKIMENFNSPFLAKNILDFWQRWHISLGQWIKDEIYLPLIRNYGKVYSSIFFAFVLIGIWHGLTWNYLIWGIAHGTGLAITQKYLRHKKNRKINSIERRHNVYSSIFNYCKIAFSIVFTLCFVSIISTFANAKSLDDGLILLKNLITIYV